MDFLNQIGTQLRELFESMTPGARVTAGLLLAVVLVSVGFLFKASSGGPDEYLFGGEPLTSSQIHAMTAAMSDAGLNGWEIQGAHIKVPRSNRHEYLAAVAAAGALPSDAKDFMQKALEGGSVFDTREQKLERIKLATEQELSHILSWYPWVEEAAVKYDLKSIRGVRATEKASATVSIRPKAGETLDGRRARNIQKLVAGGFTSMSPGDVTVNNLGGDDSFVGVGGDADADGFETPYHRERARVENEKQREILAQLSHIPGVRVKVNAILNEVMQQNVLDIQPDTPVAVSETTNEEKTEERTTDTPAPVGGRAQGPLAARGEQTRQRDNIRTVENNQSTNNYRVGESTTQEVRAGMNAKEIHASIAVPNSYVLDVWRERQKLLTGEVPDTINEQSLRQAEDEVIRKVEETVKPLLPKLITESEYKQVKVVIVDTLPSEPLPPPSLASNALAWTSRNGASLAMAGLAVFSLLMLRSMVRSSPDGDDGDPPVLQLGADGEILGGEDDDEDEEGRPRLKLRQADSLKDDLSEMVREDPDAAAAILRGWIGNAG